MQEGKIETSPLKLKRTASLSESCPNCGGVRMSNLFTAKDWSSTDTFQVWQCESCSFGVTRPMPADIGAYYPENYRHFNPLISAIMTAMYRARVRSWQKHFPKKGAALEVGCGNGWMIQALAEYGWKVVGFERDERVARRLSEAMKIEIFSGGLEQLGTQKFDLILMFNVIEHLTDPFAQIKRCAEMLNDGGTIILSTQNFASLQAKWTGAHWSHLDVPRHLFHFSARSFDTLFAKNSLQRIRTSTMSWIHDPYGWIVSFQNALGFDKDLLTVSLMSWKWPRFFTPKGLLLVTATAVLGFPAIILSVVTWVSRTGGLIEVWARKMKI